MGKYFPLGGETDRFPDSIYNSFSKSLVLQFFLHLYRVYLVLGQI